MANDRHRAGRRRAATRALALLDAAGEVRPLDEIEAEVIRFAITHYRGQMSEVARRLRIGRSTLYRKLDVLGLNDEDDDEIDDALQSSNSGRKLAGITCTRCARVTAHQKRPHSLASVTAACCFESATSSDELGLTRRPRSRF